MIAILKRFDDTREKLGIVISLLYILGVSDFLSLVFLSNFIRISLELSNYFDFNIKDKTFRSNGNCIQRTTNKY